MPDSSPARLHHNRPVTPAHRARGTGFALVLGALLLVVSAGTTTIPGMIKPFAAEQDSASRTTEEAEPETEAVDEPEETETAEETTTTTPPPPPPPPTTTPPPDSGLLPTTIGQSRGIMNTETDEQIMTFTVDSIAVDPGCNGPYADPPAYGHFVVAAITLNVLTTIDGSGLFFSDWDWGVIGLNGVRDNDNSSVETYMCAADNEVLPPGPLGPGTYVGLVILDTPNPTGTLTWTPMELGGVDGWSWAY